MSNFIIILHRLQLLKNYPIGIQLIVRKYIKLEKILKKINFQISKNDIEHIITASPDTIERVLHTVRLKINQHLSKKKDDPKNEQILKNQDEPFKLMYCFK